jgi:PD-(D/E)XK nuclease superfamily
MDLLLEITVARAVVAERMECMTLIDRSRIIAFQTCPRQRFLAYHFGGTGLQRKAKALPLMFGGAFHEGCPDLLGGDVETAVYRAMKFLNDAFAARGVGFDGEEMSDVAAAMQYGREEQCALAEGLLRAWWAFEGERFLGTFEVLECEKEGRAYLTNEYSSTVVEGSVARYENGVHTSELREIQDNSLVLMFRPDALVRERETGDLYVVSWKTCSTFNKRTVDQAKTDMQSMSEVWGLQQTFEQPVDIKYTLRYSEPATEEQKAEGIDSIDYYSSFPNITLAKIEGVLYKFVVKGSRRKDSWDGLYKQGSHLVYGWVKLATEKSEFPEWSWCYEFETEDGKSSRLGKGWQKKPIWSAYPGGVKAWVEALSHNEIFPRHQNALEAIFPQAMPVERRADEIEHWKAQVIAQEVDVEHNVQLVRSAERLPEGQTGFVNCEELLDMNFPQHTHSCSAYSGCPMADICWNPEIGRDPLGSGLYEPRSANHPEKDGDE